MYYNVLLFRTMSFVPLGAPPRNRSYCFVFWYICDTLHFRLFLYSSYPVESQ